MDHPIYKGFTHITPFPVAPQTGRL